MDYRKGLTLIVALLITSSSGAHAKKGGGQGDAALQAKVAQGAIEAATMADCNAEEGKPSLEVEQHKYDREANKWGVQKTSIGACQVSPRMMIAFVRFGVLFTSLEPKLAGDKDHSIYLNIYDVVNGDELTAEYTKAFGGDLIKNRPKDGRTPGWFPQYDKALLAKAFDALYVKPSTTHAGFTAQKIYDYLFKQPMRKLAGDLPRILADKAALAEAAKAYQAAAKTEGFHAPRYLDKPAAELSGPQGGDDEKPPVSGVVLGMVLRRHLDGTLPLVIQKIKQVLRDYDKEAFAQVKALK